MTSLFRAIFSLFLALNSLITVIAQDTSIPLECNDGVQVIAVVGLNITNGTDSYGLTISFIQNITASIPDSSNFSVNYERDPPWNDTAKYFIIEVQEGEPALLAALNNYTTECPDTPVVLHGYSEGAAVVMNLLCGASSDGFPSTDPLNSSYASNIIGVIIYGDETRTANQTYNYGSCTASAPWIPRLEPDGCAAFAPVMRSYCFDNDIDCCGTANASAPWPGGVDPHWLYPQFDVEATDFVMENFEKFKNGTFGNVTSLTSSSSSSSSTTASPSSSTTIASCSTTTTTSSSSSSTTTTTSSVSSTTTTSSSFSSAPTTTPSSPTTATPLVSTSSTTTSTTCTTDRCLKSFANHPKTASRYCSALTNTSGSATVTASPFPSACAGDYPSRASSACRCLFATA